MDIYAEVTDRIIAELEKGQIPWQKPWVSSGLAVSHNNGRPYSLLNQMLLGEPGEYATFKQIKDAGGHVRKGEKARMVVFWKWLEKEDDETKEKKKIPFLRYYNVFHLSQCDGIEPKYAKEMPGTANADSNAEKVMDEYISREGIVLNKEAGDRAFYRPATDSITLPLLEQFKNTAEYYSTAFHEMVHSTGHKKRLDRLVQTHFGESEYSKEELVAEIGSATLVSKCGLETADSFRNSTAYIQNWLQVLKDDKRFIVSAAGKAEKAVKYIYGEQDTTEPEAVAAG